MNYCLIKQATTGDMQKVQVQKLTTLAGHRDCVYALAPSNDDRFVFSAAGDGMVVSWDLEQPEEGQLIARLPNSVYAIHYLPEKDLLVAGHNYEGVHLLDWRNKKERASLKLSASAIFDIQHHQSDLFVAAGDGVVYVIDLDTWTIKKRIHNSERSARSIALHPERSELAVGYSDHFIRVFDLNTYQLKKQWPAHENSVFTLCYQPEGKTLISGSRDARLKSWRVGDDYALDKEVVAHLFAINHIAHSPDGKHFVTCSMDKSIKVWDAAELSLLKVIDKARHAGHGTSVNKLLWTSFNNQLISASDDRTLSVWGLFFNLQPNATQS